MRDDLAAPVSWDIGFLVVSVLLVTGGLALYRRGAASTTAPVAVEVRAASDRGR